MSPKDLRYSQSHEWVRWEEKGLATIGITDYAQSRLGDIVFLSLPQVGARFRQQERIGEIESVKAVADLFSPLSGEVIEVNQALGESPELVNRSPYGAGWLVKLKVVDPSELGDLMTADQYEEFVARESAQGG